MVKENAVKKKISKDQYHQTIFYDKNAIKSEISNKKIAEFTVYLENIKHTFKQIMSHRKIAMEIRKYTEWKDKNTTYKNLQNAGTVVLRGNFITQLYQKRRKIRTQKTNANFKKDQQNNAYKKVKGREWGG